MHIETIPVGPLETNCYLVWDESSHQALLIDPGGDTDHLLELIRRHSLSLQAILLTHAHIDHILGVGQMAASLDCPVWLHPDDHPLYNSPVNALPPWLPPASGLPAPSKHAPSDINGLEFEILHTPGHTPGGCCFYFASAAALFAGDTLFAGSIGRTDLPGGDHATLLKSIRDILMPLPPATRVFPGHGPSTTIGQEKSGNIFVAASLTM